MPSATLVALAAATLAWTLAESPSDDAADSGYAATFDAHWKALRDGYPYFDLYGVDWVAERDEHRPRALAATNDDEFAWELARLIGSLPDPHVAFLPALDSVVDRWSYPDVDTVRIGRRLYVVGWPDDAAPDGIPPAFADLAYAYPELIEISGCPPSGAAEVLAAGPLGSTFDIRLRWPDGTESPHTLTRPETPNLAPLKKHLGDDWLVTGRSGKIGYMAVRTFDPSIATLGPDGKMTTMLRAALRDLDDTEGLILDFQGNGGGLVAASDPFLGNLVERRVSYAWGNSKGRRRVIRPRRPRYKGAVVA
ncbi:MAG: S41 family peptidase, partial [Planctomycetota bacterium]